MKICIDITEKFKFKLGISRNLYCDDDSGVNVYECVVRSRGKSFCIARESDNYILFLNIPSEDSANEMLREMQLVSALFV